MRNIDKYKYFSVNLESVITRHYKNVYQVWLCLLSEITILTSFFFYKIDSSEYVIQILGKLSTQQFAKNQKLFIMLVYEVVKTSAIPRIKSCYSSLLLSTCTLVFVESAKFEVSWQDCDNS